MKNLFLFICSLVSFFANSQTICNTANEGGTLTLRVPAGNIITSINFASYGTPNGVCGSFTIGACHAVNSQSIVEAAFIGQNSASINATNGVFGDPCGGTVKRLYVEATYSSILPLRLISFSVEAAASNTVYLKWKTEQEVNTGNFEVEKSLDGRRFEIINSVAASGNGDAAYSIYDTVSNNVEAVFYRLKMIDLDGQFRYSSILKHSTKELKKMSINPVPASATINIISPATTTAIIYNSMGEKVLNCLLIQGSNALDISALTPGVYFLRSDEQSVRFVKN